MSQISDDAILEAPGITYTRCFLSPWHDLTEFAAATCNKSPSLETTQLETSTCNMCCALLIQVYWWRVHDLHFRGLQAHQHPQFVFAGSYFSWKS